MAEIVKENLSRKEAAAFLCLSPQTLSEDVVTQRLKVPFYKLGARCIYRLADLRQWMDARAVNAVA